jgi:hypothetical protein
LIRIIESHRSPEEAADERTSYAEQDCYDEAAGIATRSQQLRNDPDNQSGDNPRQNPHTAPSCQAPMQVNDHG